MGDTLYATETVHGELVEGGVIEGNVDGKKTSIDIKTLRERIPTHCFEPSTARSLGFLARDLVVLLAIFGATLGADAWLLQQQQHQAIFSVSHIYGLARLLVRWGVYPCLASLPLTGLWVLAHECGHGAFMPRRRGWLADGVGFVVHSALLLPYFAWRSSHARHHQFANNLATDLNYVPPRRAEYRELLGGHGSSKVMAEEGGDGLGELEHLVEDAPLVVLLRIALQQLIGWPWYLLTHITAGAASSPRPSRGWWDNSHYVPSSSLLRDHEFGRILASDVGVGATLYALYLVAQSYGLRAVLWGYVVPWMWVNHWIVMITYLHHTSPALPKYAPESWTYLRGALATVDRDPGFLLRHMFHHIIDLHVVHHLFPRIPHYHAQEATDAIKPLLGEYYHTDKGSYWGALWVAFTQCQWVEPDAEKTRRARVYRQSVEGAAAAHVKVGTTSDETGILWYRPGKMPSPATVMRS